MSISVNSIERFDNVEEEGRLMNIANAGNVRTYYDQTAKHYDPSYEADTRLKDIPFYQELAKIVGGHVLEVACGSGRVLIPTARLGVSIDGLDFSGELLQVLRDKLSLESVQTQQLVRLYEGDMRNFKLDRTYDLITIPFRPLQHLFTTEDQLSAFKCFNTHLKVGGTLAFNVFYPIHKFLDEIGVEKVELKWASPIDASIRIERSFIRNRVDKLNQFFDGEFIYRSYRGDSCIGEERASMRMSYYTYPQIKLLLSITGFESVEEYGSFNKEPISICEEMIFVAKKIR